MSSKKLAFLGLGVMGYPMAGHLAKAGHAVTVYNRSAGQGRGLGRAARRPLGRNAGGRRARCRPGDDVRGQRQRRARSRDTAR